MQRKLQNPISFDRHNLRKEIFSKRIRGYDKSYSNTTAKVRERRRKRHTSGFIVCMLNFAAETHAHAAKIVDTVRDREKLREAARYRIERENSQNNLISRQEIKHTSC